MEARKGSREIPKRNTRTVTGDYIAEVVVDTTSPTEVFHWFVRRRANFEVVIVGEAGTQEIAQREAEDQLRRLSEIDRGGASAELRHSAGA